MELGRFDPKTVTLRQVNKYIHTKLMYIFGCPNAPPPPSQDVIFWSTTLMGSWAISVIAATGAGWAERSMASNWTSELRGIWVEPKTFPGCSSWVILDAFDGVIFVNCEYLEDKQRRNNMNPYCFGHIWLVPVALTAQFFMLNADDWVYFHEGGANMIFKYCGDSEMHVPGETD